MATSHNSTHSPVSTSQHAGRVSISVRPAHLELLQGYCEISGKSLSSLVDEAFHDYIHCVLQARSEAMLTRAKWKQRTERKAKEREEIAGCLASLERLSAFDGPVS